MVKILYHDQLSEDCFVDLKVQDVVSSNDTVIVGINVNDNSITLPTEISLINTLRIASFVYHNLSHLLPPNITNQTLISPVISSTCNNCTTTNLTQPVTITFNISTQQVMYIQLYCYCVFLDIR